MLKQATTENCSVVFQDLTKPYRQSCYVPCHTLTFLTWNNWYDLEDQQPTRSYQSQTVLQDFYYYNNHFTAQLPRWAGNRQVKPGR